MIASFVCSLFVGFSLAVGKQPKGPQYCEKVINSMRGILIAPNSITITFRTLLGPGGCLVAPILKMTIAFELFRSFLVGAFINKRARLLQSLVFL